MIFAEPTLSQEDHKVLEILEGQRRRLRIETQHNPRRWHGALRRSTFARAIQGSNAIEGYNATMDDAIAAVENEPPLDERTETWLAIQGYRTAMTCIMQAAADPYFEFSKQFLKSLHFMMTEFDLNAHPGTWRPGAVQVVNHATGVVVYDAPSSDLVDSLGRRVRLNIWIDGSHQSVVVAAAMAHLNLAMIHPFKRWKRPDGKSSANIGACAGGRDSSALFKHRGMAGAQYPRILQCSSRGRCKAAWSPIEQCCCRG